MDQETISKLIPVAALLVLGGLEAIGGLYFHDKRSKNDITIELVCLTVLPTLIQPAILAFVLFTMDSWFFLMKICLLILIFYGMCWLF